MPSRRLRTAFEFEAQLFHQSPHYLLASFGLPAPDRDAELDSAAKLSGLRELLRAAGAPVRPAATPTDEWLALLGRCAETLKDARDRLEAVAFVASLRAIAIDADRSGVGVATSQVWAEMVERVNAASGAGGVSQATLRGRRWQHLRTELANALEHLASRARPRDLLPRPPRTPSTFERRHQDALREALDDPLNGGLAVIRAQPGSWKTELALTFARESGNRYAHRFWLRASDRYRLELDFMEMAKMLVGPSDDRAFLRREAFRYLEESANWLIVFNDVVDPAFLLQFLPLNPRGHKLCTYYSDQEDDRAWAAYLNVERFVQLAPMTEVEALEHVRGTLDQTADEDDLRRLAYELHSSRRGLWLAARAINYAAEPVADYLERWRRCRPVDEDGVDLSGQRAALLTLELLTEAKGPERQLHRAAAELLGRLAPYAAGSFPEEVLDDEDWVEAGAGLDDPRLVLLDQLGLASRSAGLPHVRYFTIDDNVSLVAAAHFRDGSRVGQAPAARTLLHLLSERSATGPKPFQLELLPQTERLAAAETQVRPLVAIELHASAALLHMTLGRIRAANVRMLDIDRIAKDPELRRRIRATLGAADDDWPLDADGRPYRAEAYAFPTPIKRMWMLIRSLRLAGFPEISIRVLHALDLLDDWNAGSIDRLDRARTLFEGALALRDGDAAEAALVHTQAAGRLFRAEGEEMWTDAAEGFEATIAFDRGALDDARAIAERVRSRHPEEPGEGELIDGHIGRLEVLLGRIADREGRVRDAQRHMERGRRRWWAVVESKAPDRHDVMVAVSRNNFVAARSGEAAQRAALGDVLYALGEAEAARREVDELHFRGHRSTTLVLSEAAEIERLAGRVVRARAEHLHALDQSARLWGSKHWITNWIRAGCAVSLLDAGDPAAALQHLEVVLDTSQAAPSGGLVLRGRALTTVGRLLVACALELEAAEDHDVLNLADDVLIGAERLLATARTGPVRRHPDIASCLLGRAEIALRTGRAPDAAQLAEEAVAIIQSHDPINDLPLVPARARLMRARAALFTSLTAAQRDALVAEAARLAIDEPSVPSDRLEVAFAQIAVWRAQHGDEMFDEAKKRFEHALAPLRRQIGDEPHHLVARAYLELAGLASSPHVRSRNERERDRSRPLFAPGDHQRPIDRRLVRALESLEAD